MPSVPMGFKHAIAGDTHGGPRSACGSPPNDFGLAHLVDGKIIEQVPWQNARWWARLRPGARAGWRRMDGAAERRDCAFSCGPNPEPCHWAAAEWAPGGFGLERDRHGTLWAATENGLSRIANGRVATLTTENGLPCNTVHWVIEDDLSSYSLYTRCGLLRIARTEMDAWAADPKRTIQATTFDTTDGVSASCDPQGFQACGHEVVRRQNLVQERQTRAELHLFIEFISASTRSLRRSTSNRLPPDCTTYEAAARFAPTSARPQSGGLTTPR